MTAAYSFCWYSRACWTHCGSPTRLGSLGASTEITALGILVRMPASVAFIWASPPASVPTMMSALIPSAASRLSEDTCHGQVGQRPSRT